MSRNFGIQNVRADLGGGKHPPARYAPVTQRDSISNVYELAGANPRVLTARSLGTGQENQALIRLDKIPNLPDLRGGDTVSSFISSDDRELAAWAFVGLSAGCVVALICLIVMFLG